MLVLEPLSTGAAFAAGLVTSLHCAGMCGPLACAVLPASASPDDAPVAACAYQMGRLASYTALGALAGGLGRLPLTWLPPAVLRFSPFVVVVVFAGLALGWDRRWAKPVAPLRLLVRWSRNLQQRSRVLASAAVGLGTPFLPCGPLYFFGAVALLAGSAVAGAERMLAFGLGTLPLLWVAQAQFARFQRRFSPRGLARVRVALALTAALVAAWRTRLAFEPLGFAGWLCH